MAAPGLTPRSPVSTLGPVLVTVEPPRTAKLWAVPSDDWAQTAATPQSKSGESPHLTARDSVCATLRGSSVSTDACCTVLTASTEYVFVICATVQF